MRSARYSEIADPDETHLVINATVRDDVFEACVATFSPLGVNRLLLTHMDENIGEGDGLNLIEKGGLASSFYGDGADLSDGLHEYMAAGLAGVAPHRESAGGQVTHFYQKTGADKNRLR